MVSRSVILNRLKGAQEPFLFLFHLLSLIVFSLFAFGRNPARLGIGNDGPMVVSLAEAQLTFFGISPNLHSNVLQGLGNLSFPVNLSAVPAHWLSVYNSAGQFAPGAMYACFAALLFASVALVGWNHRFPRGATYAAAWLLTLLSFPYFGKYFAIYPVTASSPIFVLYIFAAVIADIGIWRMGKDWRSTIAYAGLILLGILIMLIVSPAAVILILPFLCISAAVALYAANRQERKRKLAGAGGVLVLMAALGWVEYVLGLLLSTNSSFFVKEMMASYLPSRQFASILFQGRIADRAFGPFLFVPAAIQAVMILYYRQNIFRNAAMVTVAGQVALAGIGSNVIRYSGGWSGPALVYCEMMFFPLYALFTVLFVMRGVTWAAKKMPVFAVRMHELTQQAYVTPPTLALVLVFFIALRPAVSERELNGSYAMPPLETPVTKMLAREIGIRPGAPFAGRVANVMPGEGFWPQTQYFYRLNNATGNDHQTTGLWLKGIPTLHEYNQLITPFFYRIIKRFLSVPDDTQNRSWTNFSRMDADLLKLLGVRYILSTESKLAGAYRRTTLRPDDVKALQLFELSGANVTGIAAQEVMMAETIGKAEDMMAAPGFRASTAVLMQAPKNPDKLKKLSPARDSLITVEKGGWRIRASSSGTTLLILPIEFSRCLDITTLSGDAPEAMRVDIALTGLLFAHEVDVKLAARTGPFASPRCRLKDYRDFATLHGKAQER